MKLIALKKISARILQGQVFEIKDRDGHVLKALKLARDCDDAITAPAQSSTRRASRRRERALDTPDVLPAES